LGKDGEILKTAREAAQNILEHDPKLESPENSTIRLQVESIKKSVVNWSRIG
ncbi:MAG TPA: hypothetical protein PKC10_09500, partial [Cyclobacteriaceae bacterium]|nr:hypothetical protein [Cyclobacteriaceae bacterium]